MPETPSNVLIGVPPTLKNSSRVSFLRGVISVRLGSLQRRLSTFESRSWSQKETSPSSFPTPLLCAISRAAIMLSLLLAAGCDRSAPKPSRQPAEVLAPAASTTIAALATSATVAAPATQPLAPKIRAVVLDLNAHGIAVDRELMRPPSCTAELAIARSIDPAVTATGVLAYAVMLTYGISSVWVVTRIHHTGFDECDRRMVLTSLAALNALPESSTISARVR